MTTLSPESPAVQGHLTMLQGVISRLAQNSASCKGWCLTLVSAIVVIAADKQRPELLAAAAMPLVLFWYLDAYYLALERRFRAAYDEFVRKMHVGAVAVADVFALGRADGSPRRSRVLAGAAGSASVAPFYATLLVLMSVVALTSVPRRPPDRGPAAARDAAGPRPRGVSQKTATAGHQGSQVPRCVDRREARDGV